MHGRREKGEDANKKTDDLQKKKKIHTIGTDDFSFAGDDFPPPSMLLRLIEASMG